MITEQIQNYEPSQAVREGLSIQLTKNLLIYPEAIQYLEDRGISKSMVESHGVGFCPPYFSHYSDGKLLLSPLMKGRITVPVRNVHGSIVAFAGRQFEPMISSVERAFWAMYPNSPADAQARIDKWKRGKWINESFAKKFHLFHLNVAKQWAREMGFIVLVEGYFDSLMLEASQLPNNSALCGTRLTAWHAAMIARYCRTAIMLLDGDAAGENALEHIKPCLDEAGITFKYIVLPPGYDPDTFIIRYGDRQLIKAVNMLLNDSDLISLKLNAK